MLFPGRVCRIAAVSSWVLVSAINVPGAATLSFRAGVNGYAATQDTHVRDDQPGSDLGNATSIRVDGQSPVSHGLLRFDDIFGNGAGQIPYNSRILSATVTLRSIDPGDAVEFHRMLIDWSGTNTWDSLDGGLSADDAEMAAEGDAAFTPTGPIPRIDAIDVTASVQAWSDGTVNYGWGILPTGADGWLFQSSESTVISNRPMLTVTYEHADCLVQIVNQPSSAVVRQCESVTFTVQATGCRLQYQWSKDDLVISGATNASYTIPRVSLPDQGRYYVRVSNEFGSVTSNPAFLTVSLDVVPPTVACAYSTNDPLSIVVRYSMPVRNAADPFNYEVASVSGANSLQVSTAEYVGGSNDTVRLTLNANTPMAADTAYHLRVENVYDECAGNAINPNVVTPIVRFASPILRIASGYQWRFNDQGIDLGTSWTLPGYTDSGWPLGPPVFDAHRVLRTTVSGQPIGTHTSVSNAAGAQVPAHYFRTHFQFGGNPFGAALSLRPFIDDGAIFYLNGTEIFRIGMPPGAASYNTLANRTVTTANFEGPFVFCVPQLRQGDNVLAVEVHQASLASPDLTFAAEADLLLPTPLTRLHISLSADRSQATVTWDGGGRLETSNNLADPNAWQEIQNATSPYGPVAVSGARFFRVQKP